jgi:SAM-dependent methyltransferase
MLKNPTLVYYDEKSTQYVQDTCTADVSKLRQRFLKCLKKGALILDFGCGSGRDSNYFLENGYVVDACDGSEKMCRLARANTGLPVRHMLFQELKDNEKYDGIWACASILHLSKPELTDVLQRMYKALKPGGYAYASFKYGNFEGERSGRYYTDMTEGSLTTVLEQIEGFRILEMWVSTDVRKERRNEKWLNVIFKKETNDEG